MFEYVEQAQSAVRRINYRLEGLARELGRHSPIVDEYAAKLDILLGGNLRFKNGVPQLHHPAQIFRDETKRENLEQLDKTIRSWGGIRTEYQKAYETAQEAEPFGEKIDFKQFVNVSMNLPSLLGQYGASDSIPSDALEILKITGRKKTYDELDRAVSIMRRDGVEIPFTDF